MRLPTATLLSFVLCTCAVATAFAAPAKKPITVDAIRNYHPVEVSAPVWAPDGNRFAYTTEGKIWIYDLTARRHTSLIATGDLEKLAVPVPPPDTFHWQNRRVRERRLQWTPDSAQLLVSEGRDLFLVNAKNGKFEQVTKTAEAEADPQLSPDGRRVSYRLGNDLYVLELAGRKLTRLTHDASDTLWNARLDWVYPEELDLSTAHWWAPDSRSIAYLQFDVSREPVVAHTDNSHRIPRFEPQRYPKAGDPNADVRVGVVSAEGGRTRWMDVGETRDMLLARVDWLPDSSAVALQRLTRVQDRLELLLADAATGATRLLLREASPYWVNVGDELRFLKNGREFLWSSERDGYRHLYLYSTDGSLIRQLTRGDWELTNLAALDEASRRAYYISTQASPMERHLYSVSLNGGEPRRLTIQAGTHSASISPNTRHMVLTHSSLETSPSSAIMELEGFRRLGYLREPATKLLEEYDFLPVETITVEGAGGVTMYAHLIRPAGFQPGTRYPAIVSVYGGPGAQSVTNSWAGLSTDQLLAHQGYVVWKLDNRGTAGRGTGWQFALYRNLGAVEVQDQARGVEHLLSLGFVDAGRIGIHGWSYGGFMTLNALLRRPDLFSAGVAGASVTDFRLYDTIYTERYMGLPVENEENYRQGAPVTHASKLEGALLLVHNLQDDNVHFQNTVQMADALVRAGKPFYTMFYSLKTHGVSAQLRPQMLETMLRFFNTELKSSNHR